MVRTFGELTAEERPLAGGKGGRLARLCQAGYPVPDGFVVLPAAFAGDELAPGPGRRCRRTWPPAQGRQRCRLCRPLLGAERGLRPGLLCRRV